MRQLVLSLISTVALFAAGTPPLVLSATGNYGSTIQIQQPVEQQTQGGSTQPDQSLWVVNNTRVPWDTDDIREIDNSGYLDPGQSSTFTENALVADWVNHIVAIEATSQTKSANFIVSARLDDGLGTNILATSRPATLIAQSTMYAAVAIFSQVYQQSSSKLSAIPNSGFGGIGRMLTVTWTVTNNGARRITLSVHHMAESQYHLSYWCPEGNPFNIANQHVTGDPSFAWCQAATISY